jgi:hypothetical protein
VASSIPSWVQITRAPSPLLLVAPHGGRRHDLRIPGRHKVNDLLTADVTRALAAACGASAIVNEHLDRNTLDLNRITQLRRDAPWMIDLMAEMLEAVVAQHGYAVVLVIHGWNVTQTVCDVGVGLREHGDALAPVRSDAMTVSAEFVESHVRALQAAAVDAGATVTIGSRYPAAHANNALQHFRNHGDTAVDTACPIAALCGRARVEAVQLELGIPLRWPGPRRDRFVAVLADVFGRPRSARAAVASPVPTRLRAVGGRVTERRGVQCIAGDTLLMVGVDASDDGPVAGRVVISRGPDELVLFTGELSAVGTRGHVPPLAIEPIGVDGFRVTYEGPLVRFPMLTPFLDLERGLASGALAEGVVELTFTAGAGGLRGFGDVRGVVAVDGRPEAIAVVGVATTRGDTFGAQRFPSCRLTLPDWPVGPSSWGCDPDEPLMLRGDGSVDGGLIGEAAAREGIVALRARGTIALTTEGGTLDLAIRDPAAETAPLRATLERPIPVRRPGRDGMVVETTFALVRADGRYLGWLELSLERPAAALDVT